MMMRPTVLVVLLLVVAATTSYASEVKPIPLVSAQHQQQQPVLVEPTPLKSADEAVESMPAIKLTKSEPVQQQADNNGGVVHIRLPNLMSILPSLFDRITSLRSPESFAANEETLQKNAAKQPMFVGNEEALINKMNLNKNKFVGDDERSVIEKEESAKMSEMPLLGGKSDPEQKLMHWDHRPIGVPLVGGRDDPDHQRAPAVHLLGGPSDPDNGKNKMLIMQREPVVDEQPQQPEPGQQQQQIPPRPPHGVLTILLLKSKSDVEQSESSGSDEDNKKIEAVPPMGSIAGNDDEAPPNHAKVIFFRLKNMFGSSDDQSVSSSSDNSEGTTTFINPFALFDRIRQHMLQQQQQLFDEQFPAGSDQMPPPFDTDSLDARHDQLIRRLHMQQDMDEQQQQQPKKKCVMLSFMRWRASVYYRTAIHLLFFSGLMLFILLVIMIAMRTCRQRRQQQRLRQLSVSTITGAGGEKVPPVTTSSSPGFYIFRLGSLRSTDPSAMKKAAEAEAASSGDSGLLPPPAYDQCEEVSSAVTFSSDRSSSISSGRSKASATINSLVQAFKSRYGGNNNSSGGAYNALERRASLPKDNTSLPPYDELAPPKK